MKAILFTRYGDADALRLSPNVEKPAPKPGEVLIKVHAASINSWDWELLRGTPFANRMMFGLFRPKKINILGCDIAGVVEATGDGVAQLRPGDAVFGDLSGHFWGGFAEYVCAPGQLLARKPPGISFEQAAALPQAGVLALQGLRQGQLSSGQQVLINGAGGGAGTFAIQLAKAAGAVVTGVDSGGKLDTMRAQGADAVIDYTREDFAKNGQRYDLILDMQATRPLRTCRASMHPGGRYVVVGGAMGIIFRTMLLGPLFSRLGGQRQFGLLLHKPDKADLETLSAYVEAGTLKPVIERSYPLEDTPEAMRHFGTGRVCGKLVITLAPNQTD